MPAFETSITYENVAFGYRSEQAVLEDVTFEARAGQITALVGPTGSGKTTLVTLLLHLYELNGGAIRIDGLNINRIKLDSLRRNISIALQENILFGTTVRENIRYAVPNAGDDDVIAAARIACADEFIGTLPQGYDTLLGERGTKLSTGQRQRLSIARAVIKNTPILILDEPTAALDAETELKVIRNLTEWGKGRVILVITHRLSTIRSADQIICLRDGKVVEAGSHEELMRREGGTYRNLVTMEDAGLSAAGMAEKEVS
jgi:ABC-type multidrug transport system fused ATPase/permease subunit